MDNKSKYFLVGAFLLLNWLIHGDVFAQSNQDKCDFLCQMGISSNKNNAEKLEKPIHKLPKVKSQGLKLDLESLRNSEGFINEQNLKPTNSIFSKTTRNLYKKKQSKTTLTNFTARITPKYSNTPRSIHTGKLEKYIIKKVDMSKFNGHIPLKTTQPTESNKTSNFFTVSGD